MFIVAPADPAVPILALRVATLHANRMEHGIVESGVHAASVSARILASRRQLVGLGGASDGDDSFPHTDGVHLPAAWMFLAALTSVSWVSPHSLPIPLLTTRLSRPPGPVRAPQLLQARVAFPSSRLFTHLLAYSPLYRRCLLSIPPGLHRTRTWRSASLQASGCSPRPPPFSEPTVTIASSTCK